jgi:hypothetical protein
MSGILGGIVGNLAGGNIGRAVVSLALDTTGYNAQLEKAKVTTASSTAKMGEGFSKFKGLAVAGAAVAGAAVIAFATDAVKAASDEQESLNKARVVFGAASDSVVAFAETSAESFGISSSAALESSASFGNMLLSAGLAQDAAASMSVELVQLASDLASFNNVDPSVALERLRSGLSGQARPLRAFGILMSESAVQTEAYASGIAKVGDELTEGQKVQARYQLILKQTGTAQGDFARTSTGLANGQRILAATMEDLKAKVGAELLPALQALVPAITSVLDAVEPLITFLAGEGAQEITDIAALIHQMTDELTSLGEAVPNVAGPVGGLFDAISGGLNPVGDLVHGLADLTGATDDAAAAAEPVPPLLTDIGDAAAGGVPKISASEQAIKDWGGTVEDTFLSLESSTKDVFDITQKEAQKAFNQMLADAIRFKSDMVKLLALKPGTFGLSRRDLGDFESFMRDQGPGFIDAFVNASAAKQARWVDQWRRSVDAVNGIISRGIPDEKSVRVNFQLSAQGQHLLDELQRVLI